MRILHLSTSTVGGAGVVASTIAESELRSGHNVQMLTLNSSGYSQSFQKDRSFVRTGLSHLNTLFSFYDTEKKWSQLSSTSMSADLLDDIEVFSPEIIHIHNWFNLINLKEMKKLIIKYPCVFHIHDARLMTGGCHFTLDCNNYLDGCRKCPATFNKRYFVKKAYENYGEVFFNSAPYALLFPSRWLQRNFEESPISKNASLITRVSNPIPLSIIDSLVINKSKSIVCVIQELRAPVKGFDLLLGAVELLRSDGNQIIVKVVGCNPTESQAKRASELKVELLGRLTNSETLQVIGNSELLVVPSLSENLPTVILEAQAIGTSVLVTSIEGCLEVVEENKTGFTCEPTAQSIFEGINRALISETRLIMANNAKNESRRAISEFETLLYKMYNDVISIHSSKRQAQE